MNNIRIILEDCLKKSGYNRNLAVLIQELPIFPNIKTKSNIVLTLDSDIFITEIGEIVSISVSNDMVNKLFETLKAGGKIDKILQGSGPYNFYMSDPSFLDELTKFFKAIKPYWRKSK